MNSVSGSSAPSSLARFSIILNIQSILRSGVTRYSLLARSCSTLCQGDFMLLSMICSFCRICVMSTLLCGAARVKLCRSSGVLPGVGRSDTLCWISGGMSSAVYHSLPMLLVYMRTPNTAPWKFQMKVEVSPRLPKFCTAGLWVL